MIFKCDISHRTVACYDNSVNPYAEKWKRGRPTKEAIEKRKLYQEWNAKNLPSMSFLKQITPSVFNNGKILYKKRSSE